MLFWGLVVGLMSFFVVLMLFALVFLVRMVVLGEQRTTVGTRDLRSSIGVDEKRHSPRGMSQKANWAFVVSFGVIVMSTLAWIATRLHQAEGVQKQVAEVLASVAPEKAAVEGYLQDHGVLPENNEAMGLLPPADIRKQYVSEVKIFKGSIMLKFDESTANEHLSGRSVMLIAVRSGGRVSWPCASPDIVDKYLPGSCRIGL